MSSAATPPSGGPDGGRRRAWPRGELRRAIRVSNAEGVVSTVHGALGGNSILYKLLISLGATPMQFSVFAALSPLAQLFQLAGAWLAGRVASRKAWVLRLSLTARSLFALFGLLPFFLPAHAAIWTLLGLIFCSQILQSVMGNLWIAWISDTVPRAIRGRFFSRRGQYTMIAGLGVGLLVSALIDLVAAKEGSWAARARAAFNPGGWFRPEHLPALLAGLFVFSTLAAGLAVVILARQPERPPHPVRRSLGRQLREAWSDANLRLLMIYGLWWSLATGIGSPFWGPFMLGHLRMEMTAMQLYGIISTLAALSSIRLWGRLIDRHGNKFAMVLCILLGGFNPLVWLFATPDNYVMIYFEAASSGLMWCGAGIIATNFVLSLAPTEGRRPVYSGLYGAVCGLGQMATMLLSGWVGAHLPAEVRWAGLSLQPEQVLFGMTGIARWSALIPLAFIHEPGKSARAAWERTRLTMMTILRRLLGRAPFEES